MQMTGNCDESHVDSHRRTDAKFAKGVKYSRVNFLHFRTNYQHSKNYPPPPPKKKLPLYGITSITAY